MSRSRRGLLLATALAGCLPNTRSVPAEPFASQPGLPVYDGSVAIDPSSGRLDANWQIRFIADSNTRDSAVFRLNEKLAVTRLTGADVARFTGPHRIDGEWNSLVVHFRRPLRAGTATTMEIATSGIPVFGSDSINRISSRWVELGLDAAWHPVFASFDQRLRGTVRFELPAGWTAVASGTFNGLTLTSSVPLIDFAVSASPSLRWTESGRNRVYHTGADSSVISRVLGAAESCGGYLDARFGERERLPPARIVLPPRSGPGYARQNYIVITDAAQQTPESMARFVCHELAHFWSSGAVASGAENWLNEAFAEYVSARYVREVLGDSAYRPILAQWTEQSTGQPPVWTPTATRRPTARMAYRKAPLLLSRLEQRVGLEVMDRFLARYMTRRVPTTRALLDELRAIAGAEAADWFREELAR